MTFVTILIIIGVVIYFFLTDRNKMLENQVDSSGGMINKYSTLISWLTSDPNARITNVSRDNIQISFVMKTTATYFSITENFKSVEIEWESRLGKIMGNHYLKWTFASNISQNEMIEKIGTDLEIYENKLFN